MFNYANAGSHSVILLRLQFHSFLQFIRHQLRFKERKVRGRREGKKKKYRRSLEFSTQGCAPAKTEEHDSKFQKSKDGILMSQSWRPSKPRPQPTVSMNMTNKRGNKACGIPASTKKLLHARDVNTVLAQKALRMNAFQKDLPHICIFLPLFIALRTL